MHLIVDGANVVGSRPDGWWRDRPGAARRLAAQLAATLAADPAALAALGGGRSNVVTVHLVLEGAARPAADLIPADPGLLVVLAPADGDATIAVLAAALRGAPVVVVTADRGLRDRVHSAGADDRRTGNTPGGATGLNGRAPQRPAQPGRTAAAPRPHRRCGVGTGVPAPVRTPERRCGARAGQARRRAAAAAPLAPTALPTTGRRISGLE